MQSANGRRMTDGRMERRRLRIFVLVTGLFSFAKTMDPKHEDLKFINTSVVNLNRFVFI